MKIWKRICNGTVLAILLYSPSLWALDLPAHLQWLQRQSLSLPVSGVVSQLPVQVGQRVKAGQLLLELDTRVVKANIRRYEAMQQRLQGTRTEARRELDRAEQLYDRTVLSEHDLQLAHLQMTRAQAEYLETRALLSEAQVHLQYATLKAPFDGLIVSIAVAPGQAIVNQCRAQPLMVIADDSAMRAVAYVSEDKLSKLTEKSHLSVALNGEWTASSQYQLGLEASTDISHPGYPLSAIVELKSPVRAGQAVTLRISEKK
ncbi:MAG: efflux RND transporter periplasmic adaptor subunit [gamma proteobacterium symbiont of Bathyaustriella thionipta]|nr:efflux RND transporter periplasmic adaptor subunit [gamma proteobacterium symbiont of Bathyaustriella thionipta]